jgi:hydrogenase nickel incorporation protein HypB
MCTTCGCNQPAEAVTIKKIDGSSLTLASQEQHHHHHDHPHGHDHSHGHHHHGNGHHHHHHGHDHDHHHDHDHGATKTLVELEQDILQKNNLLAERNRGYFEARNVLAINLVSSPGSGKTSLLERSLKELQEKSDCFVIEGDQQTSNDAERIHSTGAPVVQINTGKGCHLDSDMVNQAIKQLRPTDDSLLFIENVGNLVCPALFDLGEGARVVIISVTEGDDKPIKYPDMFHSAQLCIINKIDLLPYVQFDVAKAKEYALRINPDLQFIELSATTGEGMDAWYQWLSRERVGEKV